MNTLNIKVLGPGCINCHKLHDMVVQVLEELETEATVQHVSDTGEFAKYGLLFTPGLVINDKLVCGGRIPNTAEIKIWIDAAVSA